MRKVAGLQAALSGNNTGKLEIVIRRLLLKPASYGGFPYLPFIRFHCRITLSIFSNWEIGGSKELILNISALILSSCFSLMPLPLTAGEAVTGNTRVRT